MSGSSNRTTHSGVLCLDLTTSPAEIPVRPVKERISAGSGIWCVSRYLVGLDHHLTEAPYRRTDNRFLIYNDTPQSSLESQENPAFVRLSDLR